MGYNATAPKQRANMTLNEDLVRQARGLTTNLSETAEGFLAEFVDDAQTKADQLQRRIEAHILASDTFIAKYGSLADEFEAL